jgi:hypothetical protein
LACPRLDSVRCSACGVEERRERRERLRARDGEQRDGYSQRAGAGAWAVCGGDEVAREPGADSSHRAVCLCCAEASNTLTPVTCTTSKMQHYIFAVANLASTDPVQRQSTCETSVLGIRYALATHPSLRSAVWVVT